MEPIRVLPCGRAGSCDDHRVRAEPTHREDVEALVEHLERQLRWADEQGRGYVKANSEKVRAFLAALRSRPVEPEPVEKDNEGRPYQCGAFVCGDARWECVLESDHAGEHEWRIQHHAESVGEPEISPYDSNGNPWPVVPTEDAEPEPVASKPAGYGVLYRRREGEEPTRLSGIIFETEDAARREHDGVPTFAWKVVALYASPVAPREP